MLITRAVVINVNVGNSIFRTSTLDLPHGEKTWMWVTLQLKQTEVARSEMRSPLKLQEPGGTLATAGRAGECK